MLKTLAYLTLSLAGLALRQTPLTNELKNQTIDQIESSMKDR